MFLVLRLGFRFSPSIDCVVLYFMYFSYPVFLFFCFPNECVNFFGFMSSLWVFDFAFSPYFEVLLLGLQVLFLFLFFIFAK